MSKYKLSKSILDMKVCVNVTDEKKYRFELVFPAQDRWDIKPFFPAHTMKAFRGFGDMVLVIITSILGGGEWLASHPGRFNSEERASCTHRAGLEVSGEENSNPRP